MYYLISHNIIVETSLSFGAKLNFTGFESEKGIVLAHAYIPAWQNCRTALADYDLTNPNRLAMINLDPQVLWI